MNCLCFGFVPVLERRGTVVDANALNRNNAVGILGQ